MRTHVVRHELTRDGDGRAPVEVAPWTPSAVTTKDTPQPLCTGRITVVLPV